jgi:hypothetical protein
MNSRMLGPANVQRQTMTVNGRTYTAAAGQPIDVPDFDGNALEANGWILVAPSGPSSARPAGTLGMYAAKPGVKFFDTTLDKLIEFDGAVWRDPSTGGAV